MPLLAVLVLHLPSAIPPAVTGEEAQHQPSPAGASTTEPASAAVVSAENAVEAPQVPVAKPKYYYLESRSTGTRRESEPPRYVRTLSKAEDLKGVDWFTGGPPTWVDFNLDFRFRYEYRDDDIRRPAAVLDEPILLRTRAYLGIREKLDPLRFYVEFEDARRTNSQFPKDNRDVNESEIIQAVAELYLKDALGEDRPLRLQAGRMAFEYTDRRLIARNEWRNTTNNFQGFRGILGHQKNDWQVDVLALKPMRRLIEDPDVTNSAQGFYGLIGDWRRWSEVVTLQPYYLLLHQAGSPGVIDREIHTLGLRGYGVVKRTGFDWDLQGILQFGDNGSQTHQAHAATAEAGYTFEHDWNPRVGLFLGYASGDRDPNDESNERFERLFGFARPWSANDYITMDNVIAPKVRLEFQPHERVRFDLGYGPFWLASETDLWLNANLRDPTGNSGTFMGHEADIRLRLKLGARTDVTLGYAHFIPGEFPRNLGKGHDTDFFYIEISPRLLR